MTEKDINTQSQDAISLAESAFNHLVHASSGFDQLEAIFDLVAQEAEGTCSNESKVYSLGAAGRNLAKSHSEKYLKIGREIDQVLLSLSSETKPNKPESSMTKDEAIYGLMAECRKLSVDQIKGLLSNIVSKKDLQPAI